MDFYSVLAFATLGFVFALPIAALLVVGLRRGHVRALVDSDRHQVIARPEIESDDPRIEQLGQRLIDTGLSGLPSKERTMIANVIAPHRGLPNVNQAADAEETFGDHTADQVAGFGGSWKFILLFIAGLALWVTLNTVVLVTSASRFDAYPFVFLNLILSMVAALQAPIILMSQNRQAKRDRISAELDYEVNLKAELEIMALHEKLDGLRVDHLQALIERQGLAIDELVRRSGGSRPRDVILQSDDVEPQASA